MAVEQDSYTPLSPRLAGLITALPRAWFDPVFVGLGELDLQRPALWVGNHTIYGMLDTPLLCERLLQEGVAIRPLGDRGHFKVPVWGKALIRGGMVLGSPDKCSELMRSGQHVLVFPGGGREVMRRRGEAYQLIWKRRTGFVRMAIEHGYDIIPFGSFGPDEAFDIVLDANDITGSQAWRWLKSQLPVEELTRGGDMIPPVVRGLGPTLIPRPQRFYFGFGPRISTEHLAGKADDADALWQTRNRVAAAIQDQLDLLRELRNTDKPANWSWWRRRLATLGENAQ